MKPICVKYGFRVSAILKNIYILKNLYRNSKKTMKFIKNHALPMAGAMFSAGFKPYIPVAPPQRISLKMMKNVKELIQIDMKKTQLCNRTPHTHT